MRAGPTTDKREGGGALKSLARTSTWCAAALFAVSASGARAADHAYVGAKKCKVCHFKEYNSWAATKMAKAFELLKPGVAVEAKKAAKLDPTKDYTKDTGCVACHVTGFGKKGGFVDATSTPDLAGIGCEMCHGPGGTYTQKEHMSLQNKGYKKADLVAVGLVGQVGKEQCAVCHNPKSPFFTEFDFEKRVKEGTHEKLPLKYPH